MLKSTVAKGRGLVRKMIVIQIDPTITIIKLFDFGSDSNFINHLINLILILNNEFKMLERIR